MHCLHCILVRMGPNMGTDDLEGLAREEAMTATECYENEVFDWRTEESAGRWEEEFPGKGVVLGAKEQDRFLELLETFAKMPLDEALAALKWAEGTEWGWRTMDEIEAGGYVVMPNPSNGHEAKYWSARPAGPFTITEDLIQKIWRGEIPLHPVAYNLQTALELANGDYKSGSHFFSVPDGEGKASAKTLEAARKNPEKYALVFCDYHS